MCVLSCVQLFATPWTVAHQASLSMGFSGKNAGLFCHFLFQGIFPTQGLNPHLLSHLHSRHTLYHWAQGSPNKNITTHLKILYVWTYILILGETHNHHSLSLSIPHTHKYTHTPHSMKCYFEEKRSLYLSVNNLFLWRLLYPQFQNHPSTLWRQADWSIILRSRVVAKGSRAYSVALVMSNSLVPIGPYPPRLLSPWDSPDNGIGVVCHDLLQGQKNSIFFQIFSFLWNHLVTTWTKQFSFRDFLLKFNYLHLIFLFISIHFYLQKIYYQTF